ncbi:uncharacterized protein BJX67DRAFT_360171 [Aspergillus lucknowensis]|uniref:Ecp2 effector protein domain-containing protein n=1 Tax=Aspergillus lucknowensis TaxID=176173 RepID=A0ABR4LK86_9EURO
MAPGPMLTLLGLVVRPTKGTTFSPDETGLDDNIRVIPGQGCDSYSTTLNGASILYKDQGVNLQYGGDACGPRDHGITCEYGLGWI